MNGSSEYIHRIGSPNSWLKSSHMRNGRNEETIIHESAFKVSYILRVFGLFDLESTESEWQSVNMRISQVSNSRSPNNYYDSSYKNTSQSYRTSTSPADQYTSRHNSGGHYSSTKYLNSSSNIRGTCEAMV